MPTKPANTIDAIIKPLLRCSKDLDSSSMANITPPSGVLKAAAIPAAPPAIIKDASEILAAEGNQRFAFLMIPAAICTEGPSRPRDRPPKSPAEVRKILTILSFSETNKPLSSGLHLESNAAIT